MQPKSTTEIRSAVKAIFGSKNARVTRNGEVHVRSVMPNSNVYGWWLLGFVGQYDLEDRLYWPDGSLRDAAHVR